MTPLLCLQTFNESCQCHASTRKHFSHADSLQSCLRFAGSGRVNLVPLPPVATSPRDMALAAVICSALATVLLALLVLCVIYCKRQLLEKKPSGEWCHTVTQMAACRHTVAFHAGTRVKTCCHCVLHTGGCLSDCEYQNVVSFPQTICCSEK